MSQKNSFLRKFLRLLPLGVALVAFNIVIAENKIIQEQFHSKPSTPLENSQKIKPPSRTKAEPLSLKIALTPFIPADELAFELEPFRSYLSEKLNMPVEFIFGKSYKETAQMLLKHQADIADLSVFSYLTIKKQDPDVGLIAGVLSDGSQECVSYLVVRAESNITEINQLKGKRIGFVDPQSSTGYILPLSYLHSLNINVHHFFKDVVFAGNHKKVVELLLEKKIDVAATSSIYFKHTNALSQKPNLKILAKTGRVPYGVYVASSHLPPEFVEEIQKLFLAIDTRTKQGQNILRGKMYTNGFVYADHDYYSTTSAQVPSDYFSKK